MVVELRIQPRKRFRETNFQIIIDSITKQLRQRVVYQVAEILYLEMQIEENLLVF